MVLKEGRCCDGGGGGSSGSGGSGSSSGGGGVRQRPHQNFAKTKAYGLNLTLHFRQINKLNFFMGALWCF
jgi:hypothetical protein